MKHISALSALILAFAPCFAVAAELHVDGSAAPGGTGTADAPFRTIAQAVKAARGGDVITVRGGTYAESIVLAVSGTAGRPTTLRAAPGQRVILSGFAPIEGWKPGPGGIHTAEVEGPIADLYVGLRQQPVARWPDVDRPMRQVDDVDAAAQSFRDAGPPVELAALEAVAASPRSAMAFLYLSRGNVYATVPVKALDARTGRVTLAPARAFPGLTGGGKDRYQVANHPALIARPGQWAFEELEGGRVRVHFRPVREADLAQTRYRKASRALLRVGSYQGTTSHVRIEGLEICGSAGDGLAVERSEHVAVERCIFHNNAGLGARSRRANHVVFRNNVAVANGNGLAITSARDALVEGNEVALNVVDGLIASGNITGRPGGEPTSEDVTFRRNYVHHHLLFGHPDNVQAYRGVKNLVIEDCVLLHGGQAIMTEEVDGGAVRNCVVAGTSAVAVIFGHANSNGWVVERSTVGLGGWGLFSLTGTNYGLRDNILWRGPLGMVDTLASDHNVFFQPAADQPIALRSKPRWTRFGTVEEAAAATGNERHSLRADPRFRNAPFCQAVAPWRDSNSPDRLVLRLTGGATMADFRVSDRIEINGDGVARRITAVGDDAIEFAPALPVRPFRDALVWNWKRAESFALDLRPREPSPALSAGQGGKPAGSNLDIAAFQRGDFDGDGARDIPELPEDLRAALPDPNDPVIPLLGR